jgi:hypothetical protein
MASLNRAGCTLIERSLKGLGLSAHAYVPLLRVARTITDLEGADTDTDTDTALQECSGPIVFPDENLLTAMILPRRATSRPLRNAALVLTTIAREGEDDLAGVARGDGRQNAE